MSETQKRKETKLESRVTDDSARALTQELIQDIVSVESVRSGRRGRAPKYSKLAEAIRIVAMMSRNAYRLNVEKVFELENYGKLDLEEKKAVVKKVYPILDRYLKEFARTHGYDLSKKEVRKSKKGKPLIIKGVKMATLPEYAKFKKETISMRLVGSDIYLIKQSDEPIG